MRNIVYVMLGEYTSKFDNLLLFQFQMPICLEVPFRRQTRTSTTKSQGTWRVGNNRINWFVLFFLIKPWFDNCLVLSVWGEYINRILVKYSYYIQKIWTTRLYDLILCVIIHFWRKDDSFSLTQSNSCGKAKTAQE